MVKYLILLITFCHLNKDKVIFNNKKETNHSKILFNRIKIYRHIRKKVTKIFSNIIILKNRNKHITIIDKIIIIIVGYLNIYRKGSHIYYKLNILGIQ